ncbi:MAG: cytochrome c [Acidimicrobiia bacterium]
MFRRLVNAFEILVLVAAMVFVVSLFANEPSSPDAATPGASGASSGEALFAANCARCHGSDGGGGIGPELAGGAVVDDFPDAKGEVKVVTNGRGGMPAFGDQLSAAQIAQVVEFTRTL